MGSSISEVNDSSTACRITNPEMPPQKKAPASLGTPGQKLGASEGIRTLDIHLGKVTLYQAELRSRSKTG